MNLGPIDLARVLYKLENQETKHWKNSRQAGPGDVVELINLDDNSLERFELVLPKGGRLGAQCLSIFSPLGAAVLGLSVGEVARVYLLGRKYRYMVCRIDPLNSSEKRELFHVG